MKRRFLMMGLALLAAMSAAAQSSFVLNLWPAGAPNNNGYEQDSAKVEVYLPAKSKATGRAVVICPGGGYSTLAMGHEGRDWAPFFNRMGIAVVVLKYRMPHGNYKVPMSDAYEAIRMVRRNAKNWNVDTRQVGIMGSSAGGHLASVVATQTEKGAEPNFVILFYPVITMDPGFTHTGSHDNFLGKNPRKKLEQKFSTDAQVSRVSPRAFIALSDDDETVLPANGFNYYFECYRHDVPASLHVYPAGGHGWGFKESFPYHLEMELELKAWLESF